MELIQQLSVLAVYQFLGDRADSLMKFLDTRFTDHSAKLESALRAANDRAWRTLEVALAGTSWWQACKGMLTPADEKNLQRQVRDFLSSLPSADLPGDPEKFRKAALADLRAARRVGLIPGDRFSTTALATDAKVFAGCGDPLGRIEQDKRQVAVMAALLRQEKFADLAHYIELRPPGGDPLLVAAVRYFFRRAVERDSALSAGLTTARLERIDSVQQAGFDGLHEALTGHGERLESLLTGVAGTVGQTHENVVAMREELERQRAELHEMTAMLKRLLAQPAATAIPAAPIIAQRKAPASVQTVEPPPISVIEPPPCVVSEPPAQVGAGDGDWDQVRGLLQRCRQITKKETATELARVADKFEEVARNYESARRTYQERVEEAKTESGLPIYPEDDETKSPVKQGRLISSLFQSQQQTSAEPPAEAKQEQRTGEPATRRKYISPLFDAKPKSDNDKK